MIEWSPHPPLSFVEGAPFSTLFQDTYKSRRGAFEEARQVYLDGCGLSERWRSSWKHTILELGFGLGVNFVETWKRWKDDPNRPARLYYIAIEKHPVCSEDLDLALKTLGADPQQRQELSSKWPSLMSGLHRIAFEAGRVNLFLCIGDAHYWLRELEADVDSVYLDGFSPEQNPALWQESAFRRIASLCTVNASLASYSSAPAVRQALTAAGFEVSLMAGFAGKHHRLVARLRSTRTPRSTAQQHEQGSRPSDVDEDKSIHADEDKSVLVIGAGLAGSATARAMYARGWQVTLIHDPASVLTGSAQPICVEHLHASPDDNLLAQLTRSAWQLSRSGHWLESIRNTDSGSGGKLMLLHDRNEYGRWASSLPALQLPIGFLQLLDRTQTLARLQWPPLASSPTLCGSLWFADARSADPISLCKQWQSEASSHQGGEPPLRIDQRVERLIRSKGQWLAYGVDGSTVARARVVVLCNAADAPRLLPIDSITTVNNAGQSTQLHSPAGAPRAALGGAAYLCPLDTERFLIGASFEAASGFVANEAGDADNLRRLAVSFGVSEIELSRLLDAHRISSHAGARCTTRDRLPVIGPWPDEASSAADSLRLLKNSKLPLPVLPDAYANFGYGARGLLWCTLGAELICALLHSEPAPLARSLRGAIDPSRSVRRWLRSF